MDNLNRQESNDRIVTGPRPLLVCSVCGPKIMHYAGRILSTICQRCKEMSQ